MINHRIINEIIEEYFSNEEWNADAITVKAIVIEAIKRHELNKTDKYHEWLERNLPAIMGWNGVSGKGSNVEIYDRENDRYVPKNTNSWMFDYNYRMKLPF